jgi:hypothetical protein
MKEYEKAIIGLAIIDGEERTCYNAWGVIAVIQEELSITHHDALDYFYYNVEYMQQKRCLESPIFIWDIE